MVQSGRESVDQIVAMRAANSRIRLRRCALPAMGGALLLYMCAHSPVRDAVSMMLGRRPQSCLLLCGDPSDWATTLSALAFLLIAACAAGAIAERFNGPSYERPLVFGLTMLALIVGPSAALGGIGTWTETALLRPPRGPLLSTVPAALLVAAALARGWRPRGFQQCTRPPRLVLLVAAAASVLLGGSVALSLMHPADGGDALSYHAPLAVFLWNDGNLSGFLDRAPITWALANPGTAELWYGLLSLAGGERLAELGQVPFALLGAAAVAAFTRRLGLLSGAGWLAGGAFLLAPMVVMQSTTQANDIAGAGLLMATMALACAPVAAWTRSRLAAIGLGIGLVATTKLALLPAVAGLTVFVVGAIVLQARRDGQVRQLAVRLALVALLFLSVVAPWWARNVARYGNPVYPAGVPLLGGGVFVSDFGRIDRRFVPGPAAWPLYPLIEAHDDRSGFGMLFAIGILPGMALAVFRGRRQPLLLYGVVAAFTLPSWWLLTMHEPRFLLALTGLGCASLPWALQAVPRRQRRIAGGLLGAAAVFSALVTFDQALLPLARQPNIRAEFYDRVWGVDPVTGSLPETEGLLHHTGWGPDGSDYAAYYPLLGPSLGRSVVQVDTEATTDSIVADMQRAGLRYAYVRSLPRARATVEAIYDASRFDLVHMSSIERGEPSGARRYLYRTADSDGNSAIRRYLYRLR